MLDRATQTEGWAFLHDVVHAHHPQADNDLPLAAPPIENAVGRFLIRTDSQTVLKKSRSMGWSAWSQSLPMPLRELILHARNPTSMLGNRTS